MKERLESFIHELDGVDLVLDKLESKTNVSVFEKLCSNCERVFVSFCDIPITDIVKAGCTTTAITFLKRLKGQVVRLMNYKEALSAYLEMASGQNLPDISSVSSKEQAIINENKKLILTDNEGKAA